MTPETVIDILREALWLIVLLSAVIIGPGLVIGLVVSTFQAATQINEQTLSFLPRLLITLIVIIAAGALDADHLAGPRQRADLPHSLSDRLSPCCRRSSAQI